MTCSPAPRRLTAALALVLFPSSLFALPAQQCPEHEFTPLVPGSQASGEATATDGTRVVVSEGLSTASRVAVSVYRLEGGAWIDEEALVVDAGPGESVFSVTAVEIEGDLALFSYEFQDPNAGDYEFRIAVFERGPGGWSLVQTLLEPVVTPAPPYFGGYLHLHGDQLLTSNLVYQRGPSGFSLLEVLPAPSIGAAPFPNSYGTMNDDWIVIGEPLASIGSPSTPLAGRVVVFQRVLHGGVLVEEFEEPVPDGFAQFGSAVALEGEWMFAGAQEYGQPGRVHAYRYDGSRWRYDQEIVNPLAAPFGADRFGGDIVIDGGRLAVGSSTGVAMLYQLIGDTWTFVGTSSAAESGSIDLAGDVFVHSDFYPFGGDRAHTQDYFGGAWDVACAGTPNSTGQVARLDLRGSARRSYPGLVVDVADAPANTVGIFVYGGAVGSLPVGNGELCIDPGSGLRRYPEIVQIDGNGAATRILDASVLDTASTGASVVVQLWFRDIGGAGTDWSSAARVTLCD
ncbi:MAG: hypothetical protein AAGB93_00755 [Planctomycetota bacterium]